MEKHVTKRPKNIYLYTIAFIFNIFILWFFIFNGLVLVFPWLGVVVINLLMILAVFSGWKRSVLFVDESKIVICRPSGWTKKTSLIFNLFEVNHVEFDGDYILIGRYNSSVATKFGPIANVDKLNKQLKRIIPKVVL